MINWIKKKKKKENYYQEEPPAPPSHPAERLRTQPTGRANDLD